jgi:hypothetical protein
MPGVCLAFLLVLDRLALQVIRRTITKLLGEATMGSSHQGDDQKFERYSKLTDSITAKTSVAEF